MRTRRIRSEQVPSENSPEPEGERTLFGISRVVGVDREAVRGSVLQILEEISRNRDQIRDRVGVQPDSTEMLRSLREDDEQQG